MSQIESDFDLRQSVNIYPTNEALEKFQQKKKSNNSSSSSSSSDMNLENDHETKDEISPSSEVVIPTIREEVTLEELMGGMKMNQQNDENQTLEEQELKIFNLQDAPTSNLDEQLAQHLEESQESEFKFTPSPLKDSSSQTKKK